MREVQPGGQLQGSKQSQVNACMPHKHSSVQRRVQPAQRTVLWPVPPVGRGHAMYQVGGPPVLARQQWQRLQPPHCSTHRPTAVLRLQNAQRGMVCIGLRDHRQHTIGGQSPGGCSYRVCSSSERQPGWSRQAQTEAPPCPTSDVSFKVIACCLGRPRPAAQHRRHQLGARAGHLQWTCTSRCRERAGMCSRANNLQLPPPAGSVHWTPAHRCTHWVGWHMLQRKPALDTTNSRLAQASCPRAPYAPRP